MQKPPPKQKPLSESIIQSKVIKAYEADNWLVVKIIQTTKNGWPDLQCHKNNKTIFIECKAEGETVKPGSLQDYRHQQLRKHKFTVLVINYPISSVYDVRSS